MRDPERYRSANARRDASSSLGDTTIAVITTQQVAALLSYPSASAVRQAHQRGTLPIPLYRLGSRRRLLARLADIEKVLSERLEPSRTATQGLLPKEEVS